MKILFWNNEHQDYFEKMLEFNNNIDYDDRSRIALFYILAGVEEFRNDPEKYYNFVTGMIERRTLKEGNISEENYILLKLAYDLFLGRNKYDAAIIDTFIKLNKEKSYIALNAIRLRFNIEKKKKKIERIYE